MASGEQHPGHRQHPLHALGPQAVEPIAQDRPRELQIPVFHRHARQQLTQAFRELGKFTHRLAVAASVATDQHPDRATFNGIEIKLRRGVAHGRLCLV